jgi:hypothetical protein
MFISHLNLPSELPPHILLKSQNGTFSRPTKGILSLVAISNTKPE